MTPVGSGRLLRLGSRGLEKWGREGWYVDEGSPHLVDRIELKKQEFREGSGVEIIGNFTG